MTVIPFKVKLWIAVVHVATLNAFDIFFVCFDMSLGC